MKYLQKTHPSKTRKSILEGDVIREEALPSVQASIPACGQRACPMKADASRATRLSRDLASALRRLKRRYRRCVKSGCQVETCPYFSQVQTQIQTAIAQVLEEWAPEGMGQVPDSQGEAGIQETHGYY